MYVWLYSTYMLYMYIWYILYIFFIYHMLFYTVWMPKFCTSREMLPLLSFENRNCRYKVRNYFFICNTSRSNPNEKLFKYLKYIWYVCLYNSWFVCGPAVCVTASLTADPYADINIIGTTPSSTLAVRGLPLFANEDQVQIRIRDRDWCDWSVYPLDWLVY